MKLETFFEKFDQFADAPNAVAKLRELVLELAVTGRLVTQDNRDESASLLLDSTSDERSKLVAAKMIKSRPLTPVKPDEQPFDVPLGWSWARLSNVGYELGQKVPDKQFTYIDVGGIDSDRGRISDRVEILEPGDAPSRARKLVARGTVIYSTVRPYLLNIAIVDHDFDPEPIASTAFGILHPFKGIDNRYLFYWLRSGPFTDYVQAGMKGMAYPAINDEKFYNGPIPLPPLDEQKRIVAKVDELMALCDRLEAQQQERETRHAALSRASLARFADAPTPANLNYLFHPSFNIHPSDLRKSILTLAVQGKLVPQDPADEPAEVLIERVKAARQALLFDRRVRQSDEVEYSLQDEADDAPPGWVGVHVNDVAIVQGGKRLPNGAVFSESPTPHVYIRVTDMKNGTISETGLRYISPEVQREIARYIINKEDLYITIAGTIGDVGCVPEPLDGHNLTENAAKIVFRGFDRQFFQLALTSEFVQAQFLEKTKQMAQPKLALKRIAGAKFYFPPLAEQKRIVAKVDQLMSLVDELESQLAASRKTAEELMEAAVAELTGGGNCKG